MTLGTQLRHACDRSYQEAKHIADQPTQILANQTLINVPKQKQEIRRGFPVTS